MNVVEQCFLKIGSLLIDKPKKRPTISNDRRKS